MNRLLRNSLTCLIASFMISAMFSLTMINGITNMLTKENLERCLSEINIESLLATQNLDYSQIVDNYVNDTNMSKDDVEKILESSEYSSLVGNYVMDSDMIDLSQYFDGTDIVGDEESVEDTLSSIDKTMKSEDIKDVFEKLGVNYTESDINYFKNSLTAEVAPKVQTQIDEVLNQNSQDLKKINIDGIKKIFTQKTVTTNKIIIVVCALLILLLNYKNVSFLTVYAINSFVVLVGLELFDFIIKKVNGAVPSEYATIVKGFTKPLSNQFNKDINTFIWGVIICVLLQIIMHILINKTEVGDKFSFLRYGGKKETEDNFKEMYNDFNDDYSVLADSMDFSQFDEGTGESAYDTNELKDITFSKGPYIHD